MSLKKKILIYMIINIVLLLIYLALGAPDLT